MVTEFPYQPPYPMGGTDGEPLEREKVVPDSLTYRVWFKDGSSVVLNALGATQAHCIVEDGIARDLYHGTIDYIERLKLTKA